MVVKIDFNWKSGFHLSKQNFSRFQLFLPFYRFRLLAVEMP